MSDPIDPDQYVDQHRTALLEIIKHSHSTFPRALALAALVKYGDDPEISAVIDELEAWRDQRDDTDT